MLQDFARDIKPNVEKDISPLAAKPRKYCRAFPCKNMAEPGSSYCLEHRPAPAPKQADDFYLSPEWRRFRDWFISKYPLCKKCSAYGFITPAKIVDHIVELKDGGALFDESNTQSLCHACHNRKSAKERKKRGLSVYSY